MSVEGMPGADPCEGTGVPQLGFRNSYPVLAGWRRRRRPGMALLHPIQQLTPAALNAAFAH